MSIKVKDNAVTLYKNCANLGSVAVQGGGGPMDVEGGANLYVGQAGDNFNNVFAGALQELKVYKEPAEAENFDCDDQLYGSGSGSSGDDKDPGEPFIPPITPPPPSTYKGEKGERGEQGFKGDKGDQGLPGKPQDRQVMEPKVKRVIKESQELRETWGCQVLMGQVGHLETQV